MLLVIITNYLEFIMVSGISLTHLKNQNIKTPCNFKSDIISYILNNGLQILRYCINNASIALTASFDTTLTPNYPIKWFYYR